MQSVHTIKKKLRAIGFTPVDGRNNVWSKGYPTLAYAIDITLGDTAAACRIDYGDEIKGNAGRSSTQSLSQPESLVVLECVDRLLTLGYTPNSLILERQYPLGHTHGYLDILVQQDDRAYLMIECKTWGTEFEKERARLFSNGGQLLSYFQQNRAASFITLYTSRLSSGAIERKACTVDTSFLDGDSVSELFESWDKSFFESGVFESMPYCIQERRLIKSDLADMKQEDGGQIFNAFAEILRRYVISDKPNAFNKIFNLFICKVQDEEKQDDETLDFQWQAGESAKTVLSRLNDLYKAGMSQYLRMEIADHNESEIERRLAGSATESDKQALRTIFTELRLFKNNEFAFKEVFDEKTFNANAEVVREVVRLLQGKRIRYTSKQQFLGDFFELLLNTSVKQEAGQFFTPIPITRFIIDSLPLRAIIERKINANDPNFLPYFIDYASGSGHFLTEAMDRIDRMVKSLDGRKLRTSLKGNLRKWSADYAWASEFIYGIEKDYRLAKTAKVSCFLNGDGEANLIHGDGLDSFSMSQEYIGKLLTESLSGDQRNNSQFDVVAANPPYSVSACKKTIRHGEKSFSLWPRLTESSSEIECLFIERTKQLLKPGGVAGLLLPSSILSNGGIYEAVRDILLRYFSIKAIVIMGSGTFMATGTNTVALFIERRQDDEHSRIKSLIEKYFSQWSDLTIAGQENAITLYANKVWNVDLSVFSMLLRVEGVAPEHALLSAYRKAFEDLSEIRTLRERNKRFMALTKDEQSLQIENRFRAWLQSREQEKMLAFFLACGQSIVLARAPTEKSAERRFLGYEFSNRKGSEGLKILSGTGQIETALYSEVDDADNNKINTLIRRNFLGEELVIPKALAKHVNIASLLDLISFDQVRFDKAISTSAKKKIHSTKWPMMRLGDVTSIFSGGTPSTKNADFWNGNVRWATIEDVKEKYLHETRRKITNTGAAHAGKILPVNAVLFSSRATIGEVSIAKVETATNQGFKNFVCDPSKLHYEYLFYALRHESAHIAASCSGMTYPEISSERLSNWLIPIPPLPKQHDIAKDLIQFDSAERELAGRLKEVVQPLFARLSAIATSHPLGSYCSLSTQRVNPSDSPDAEFNYVGLEHIVEGTGECAWSGPSKGAAIKSTKNVFSSGDVLYGKLRPYLNKAWVAEFDGVCTTELLVLKPRIPAQLLKYLLLHPSFVAQAKEKTSGVSLPRIKPRDVMLIPVPNIGDNIAELASLADSIESKKINYQAKLSRLLVKKQAYIEKWLS